MEASSVDVHVGKEVVLVSIKPLVRHVDPSLSGKVVVHWEIARIGDKGKRCRQLNQSILLFTYYLHMVCTFTKLVALAYLVTQNLFTPLLRRK
jgi:hypothetical protein